MEDLVPFATIDDAGAGREFSGLKLLQFPPMSAEESTTAGGAFAGSAPDTAGAVTRIAVTNSSVPIRINFTRTLRVSCQQDCQCPPVVPGAQRG